MSDATPALGVTLARDKPRTAKMLRAIGLPVPRHQEVSTADEAMRAAQALGYPVVVKPTDRDQGHGARAHLLNAEQVRQAYEQACRFSPRVLVEQHIDGREYRLIVVQGELLWASERVPAQVEGDGQQDIQTLVDQENARRRTALSHDPTGWQPIEINADLQAYLQETGWSLQAVPAKGQTVRLQRVPAATTGGGGQACHDTLHPDNRRLAERAAQLLRLDIAGVDLIMPDISRSWREVGGALTEVNAMPQISLQTQPRIIEKLLERTMPQGGRIPLIVLLAEEDESSLLGNTDELDNGQVTTETQTPVLHGWGLYLQQALGAPVGLSTAQELMVGSERCMTGRSSLWGHLRALQLEPSVGAMVVQTNGQEWLRTGLPFDRVDALVVQTHRPDVLALLLPYCRGLRHCVGTTLWQQHVTLLQHKLEDWEMVEDLQAQSPVWIEQAVQRLLALSSTT